MAFPFRPEDLEHGPFLNVDVAHGDGGTGFVEECVERGDLMQQCARPGVHCFGEPDAGTFAALQADVLEGAARRAFARLFDVVRLPNRIAELALNLARLSAIARLGAEIVAS